MNHRRHFITLLTAAAIEPQSDQPAGQAALKTKALGVSHLDGDWSLNDVGR